MLATGDKLELQYKGNKVIAESFVSNKSVIYKIELNPHLFITALRKTDSGNLWTSLPEGRQQEAEEIGELIDNYKPPTIKQPELF